MIGYIFRALNLVILLNQKIYQLIVKFKKIDSTACWESSPERAKPVLKKMKKMEIVFIFFGSLAALKI